MEWNDFNDEFELGALGAIEWVEIEFDKIRSGRVNPNIFSGIKVEVYEELMPLNQISNIQIIDARTVLIKAYDKSCLKEIANAISNSNLGVNPQLDTDFIRLVFPMVTEETRKLNVKKCSEYLNKCKDKIRDVRKEVQTEIKKLTGISEDTIKYFLEQLDAVTKKWTNQADAIFEKKQAELLKI